MASQAHREMNITIIVVTVERTCLARLPDRLWSRRGEHGISPEEKALLLNEAIEYTGICQRASGRTWNLKQAARGQVAQETRCIENAVDSAAFRDIPDVRTT